MYSDAVKGGRGTVFESSKIHFYESHMTAVEKLGSNVRDVNHFRTMRSSPDSRYGIVRANVAVVTLHDGRCYVGYAYCSPKDQYVGKVGYVKSLGRALAKAANVETQDFYVEDENGKELRDRIREVLDIPRKVR